MKRVLRWLLVVAFILIALLLLSCRAKQYLGQLQAMERSKITNLETTSSLYTLDLFILDSLVELTPRDTVTRVRYIRASKTVRDTTAAASSLETSDTIAAANEEIRGVPIAAESIKNRETGLRPLSQVFEYVGFAVFFVIFLVFFQKSLHLRRE